MTRQNRHDNLTGGMQNPDTRLAIAVNVSFGHVRYITVFATADFGFSCCILPMA